MWALKVLNGSEVGDLHSLREGHKYIVGRSDSCDIQLKNQGVSKRHLEVSAFKEKLLVKDLNSSNGTFVNGVRVSHRVIRLGDKIGLNEMLMEAVLAPKAISNPSLSPNPLQVSPHSSPSQPLSPLSSVSPIPSASPISPAPSPSLAPSANPSAAASSPSAPLVSGEESEAGGFSSSPQLSSPSSLLGRFFNAFQSYMEKVALPGVYRLCHWFEFRWVLLSFLLALVVGVVLLSLIPMRQLTQSSIEMESQRRVLTIARNLSEINKVHIIQKRWSLLNIESAELEDGVTKAFIVDKSGSILAPQNKMGTYLKLPFLQKLRRRGNMGLASQLDSKNIAAGFPVSGYNTESGTYEPQAYTVVVYNMGALAFDKERVLSLFLQALLLSLIFSLLVFYFIYKLIDYPINSVVKALEKILEGQDENIDVKFRQENIQQMTVHINNLLAKRSLSSSEGSGSSENPLHEKEVVNLAQLIGFPALVLNGSQQIIYVNPPFEQITGLRGEDIAGYDIQSLSDQALQQNIQALIEMAISHHLEIAVDQLDFNGNNYSLNCQCLGGEGKGGLESYFFIVITPAEDEQEEEVA